MFVEVVAICDNLSYIIHNDKMALVIDPSKGEIISEIIDDKNLELEYILNTHHHYDHIGGNQYLKNKYAAKIFSANDPRINLRDRVLQDGEDLDLGFVSVRVLATPGHTDCSLSFLVSDGNRQSIFTGDTLFVGGCGRVENDEYKKMWDSMQKISCLDADVDLYGGHEYALENYEFALKMFPNISEFKIRYEQLKEKLRDKSYTVPSTIGDELKSNIFLMAKDQRVKEELKMTDKEDWEVFMHLRQRKNVFG